MLWGIAAHKCMPCCVLQDPKDPHKGLYDEEVVLLLTDQNSESGEQELKALQNVSRRQDKPSGPANPSALGKGLQAPQAALDPAFNA